MAQEAVTPRDVAPAEAAGGLRSRLARLAGARPGSAAAGRCVGMFMDAPGRSGALPDTIPADATNLAVRGTVPCRDQIMGWSPRGPMRVFEDGTVEFLASPVPPCPGGDYYVWIAFPK